VLQLSRPLGKGWYVRQSMTPAQGISAADIALLKSMGIRFTAVNVANPITIKRLLAANLNPWVFGLPDQWSPTSWPQTLMRSHAVALQTGSNRVWADPENGWPAASGEQWMALGSALEQLARSGVQVCVTTHGGLRSRVAKYVAPRIAPFGGIISPQVYDHSRDARLDYAAQAIPAWERTMSGCQIVPSVGCLSTGPEGAGAYSDARYRDVFAGYPRRWQAAVVWPERDPSPFQAAVLSAWRVGFAPEIG
jgi:hypothetical protein